MLLHDGECRRCHFVRCNRERRGEHDTLHILIEEVVVLCEGTANDAVRHESDKLAVRIDDGDGTETLVRHDKERVLCRRVIGHNGVFLPRVHHVCHGQQQLAPECAARVEEGIVLLLEVTRLHERHRDRIAHCERRRCGAGRSESQGACLAFDTDVNVEVRTAPELRFASAAHGDDPRTDAMDDREDVHHLV